MLSTESPSALVIVMTANGQMSSDETGRTKWPWRAASQTATDFLFG